MTSSSEPAWQFVTINKDFDCGPTETASELATKLASVYEPEEIDRGLAGEVPLLEENVETLLLAAFAKVFADFGSMVFYRQRPLFKMPDLLAVDRVGRVSIFDLKKEEVGLEDVLAQATYYLVDCGNRAASQIARMFDDLYRRLGDAPNLSRELAAPRKG